MDGQIAVPEGTGSAVFRWAASFISPAMHCQAGGMADISGSNVIQHPLSTLCVLALGLQEPRHPLRFLKNNREPVKYPLAS
jgi:hypothetical protein